MCLLASRSLVWAIGLGVSDEQSMGPGLSLVSNGNDHSQIFSGFLISRLREKRGSPLRRGRQIREELPKEVEAPYVEQMSK